MEECKQCSLPTHLNPKVLSNGKKEGAKFKCQLKQICFANIKSQYCTTNATIMLYINYILIKIRTEQKYINK